MTALASRNRSTDGPSNGSAAGIHSVDTPIGTLLLERNAGGLGGVRVDAAAATDSADPLLVEAAGQLRAYFAGELRDFDLPLAPGGTEFQRRVWAAVSAVP